MPRPRKNKPVPLAELKFSGDPQFVLLRLKATLEEREHYIEQLENERSGLDQCASRVWSALEEAETMATRFPQYVQDAMNSPAQQSSRLSEMSRYARLFREAKDDFQRLR